MSFICTIEKTNITVKDAISQQLLTKDKEEDFWMTKKQMKAENKKRRNFWTINPTTRIKESKKIYSRKNKKIEY